LFHFSSVYQSRERYLGYVENSIKSLQYFALVLSEHYLRGMNLVLIYGENLTLSATRTSSLASVQQWTTPFRCRFYGKSDRLPTRLVYVSFSTLILAGYPVTAFPGLLAIQESNILVLRLSRKSPVAV